MYCPNCHRQINEKSTFCGYCGHKIEYEEIQEKKKSNNHFFTQKRLLIGIYGVAGISLILVVIFFLIIPGIQKNEWEEVKNSNSIGVLDKYLHTTKTKKHLKEAVELRELWIYEIHLNNRMLEDNEKEQQNNKSKGTFMDTRDNHIYRWVKIGNQIWMAENLAFDAGEGSLIVQDDPINLTKYGRIYSWESAVKACPKGWHVPSQEEWEELANYICSKIACSSDSIYWQNVGIHLKSEFGWENEKNGVDDFGFSALPSGNRHYVGSHCLWWTSNTIGYTSMAFKLTALTNKLANDGFINNGFGASVRCVKD